MPELPPPPDVDGRTAEPGWHPDPQAPGILRWWDGTEWSKTDVTLPGAARFPWWQQDAWRERFGPFSRVGSLFNLVFCSVLLFANLDLLRASIHAIWITPVVLEVAFIVIAIRAWWPRRRTR